ncbi:TPA: glycosyltransferase [Vibrio parahaemolyticus]|uniref:Predicted glycosyl transferases n=3 Tax=Vibrio parahaemolyticus TaxID=670 RepID=B3IUV0_VIBPH|nr:glycosyltransferase [Vibrio parahaemolyticus]EFO39590.1 amylovoran biosynthesis glycosyltransferase AmsE [Vibrio parahaemolyticus AN-5034]EJG1785461.1 glycosyltransferase [Vibrio parahaemolyticus]EJG1799840.1 glycosyltransferase [Vibrio parahaemolyticus]EJG1963855.1 glycosyltransferase [Vibrio parahaemolyticus]EJG2155521.1 glycosyltransferase [Vibrio parahaemolyticus]
MSSKFSVLCSLYYREQPEFLEQCFESLAWQTLQANEIVIVHDGPLTPYLYEALDKWKAILPLKQVILEENVGLGEALNEGLKACSYDLILRVDTDDINHRERFKKQVEYMELNPDISAASSDVLEFEVDPQKATRIKKVPRHPNIRKYSLKRNPMNHMATIFRKDAVIKVGSYKHHLYMEDYYLWLRLLAHGYNISNIPEPLVSARVGNGMLERRSGISYAKSEIKMMRKIYGLSLTKNPKTAFLFTTRAITRLLPSSTLRFIYNKLRK